jgi:hypothetical protein
MLCLVRTWCLHQFLDHLLMRGVIRTMCYSDYSVGLIYVDIHRAHLDCCKSIREAASYVRYAYDGAVQRCAVR